MEQPECTTVCHSSFRLAFFHVANALPRDGFRVGRIIENFDTHPASVVNVFQGSEYPYEIGVAEAGPALVGIIGMKMMSAPSMAADQVRDWSLIASHRFYVEMQDEIRMGYAIEQVDRFGAGRDKVG